MPGSSIEKGNGKQVAMMLGGDWWPGWEWRLPKGRRLSPSWCAAQPVLLRFHITGKSRNWNIFRLHGLYKDRLFLIRKVSLREHIKQEVNNRENNKGNLNNSKQIFHHYSNSLNDQANMAGQLYCMKMNFSSSIYSLLHMKWVWRSCVITQVRASLKTPAIMTWGMKIKKWFTTPNGIEIASRIVLHRRFSVSI